MACSSAPRVQDLTRQTSYSQDTFYTPSVCAKKHVKPPLLKPKTIGFTDIPEENEQPFKMRKKRCSSVVKPSCAVKYQPMTFEKLPEVPVKKSSGRAFKLHSKLLKMQSRSQSDLQHRDDFI